MEKKELAMKTYDVRIAEHEVRFETSSEWVMKYVQEKYSAGAAAAPAAAPHMTIRIEEGYGVPFVSFDLDIRSGAEQMMYTRADYRITAASDYTEALIEVHDDLALKHAMLNLYSAFIIHHEWGLLIHSSCLADKGRAFLFAGHSGAGKSTVALLSRPRPVLSDEATIVKLSPGEALIYDSPFRSDSEWASHAGAYPLAGIQLLRQAQQNRRTSVGKLNGMVELMNRVFYWKQHPEETKKVLRLCMQLAQRVPVYELYFQKNNTFWEVVS
ncbi:hypothetical protein [Paenibacillus sp. y28]|uniref:hypothetical protein n=1 Tax=Paenibacillus sp. y28 TaxID=3129110 RepID=UPI0030194053